MNYLICSILLISTFVHAQTKRQSGDFPQGQSRQYAVVSKTINHRNGSVTYMNPRFKTAYGTLPVYGVEAPRKLCNMLGHMGVASKATKIKVSHGQSMLKLYGSFKPKGYIRVNALTDYKASFQVETSDSGMPARVHFHYITQVTCTNLRNFF